VRPAAGGNLFEYLTLHRVDDPPARVVARDVNNLAVGGAGQLVGTRSDRHPARHGVADGVEPEEFPFVAGCVFDREEESVALRRRHETVRLRPDLDPLDDMICPGVDDVNVVPRRIRDVEFLRGSRRPRFARRTEDERQTDDKTIHFPIPRS
jgi:hypothetical protein